MELFENYEELRRTVGAIQEKDARFYHVAAIVFLLLALIFVAIFFPASFIFMLVAAIMLLLGRRNRRNTSTVYRSTLRKKEHWFWWTADEVTQERTEYHRYAFQVDVAEVGRLSMNRLEPCDSAPRATTVMVNESIYQHYREGDTFSFVLSPAGDLVAYGKPKKMHVLMKTVKLSDGSEHQVATTISQDDLRGKVPHNYVKVE